MSRVLIVGAGPAGASLAYLLAQRGVEVVLVERRRDFAREFRGEVLMPSGVAALDAMGLSAQLASVPSQRQGHAEVYLNRRRLFATDIDASQIPILAVSQPALLEMLVGEAAAYPGFTLLRGASVRELLRADGRVCGVRVRGDDGEQELRADLVIGADGRHSAVRREAELPVREVSPPMDIVWCKLPCPAGWQGVRAYAGRGHLLVAYHTWGDMLQLGWVILKGTFGELRERGVDQWVDEMARHVTADFAVHLRAHRDAAQKPFLLDAASDCVERWSEPGLLLIGDAAHTMSPVGGQGVNIALRDAIVAANRLGPLLTAVEPDPQRLDAALAAIEAERLPEVAQIQALQAQPPKLLLSRAWWGEPLRRLAGTLLRREAVRRRAAGRVSDFFYGVTDVQHAR